jgi:predicted DNA binding CopG/RHH family protein
MAKTKMKQMLIPKFSSEAEEAAWWDRHRSEIEAEIRQRMKQKRPLTLASLLQGAKPSQPITMRIAKEDLKTARRLAARKGVGYQTYIKMLLREALAENASQEISNRSRRGGETLGPRHVEFDAHKVVRQTAVEFGTRDGSRASFLARRPVKVPVRVSFKDNRKVNGGPRGEKD